MFDKLRTAYNLFKMGKHYPYCDEYLIRSLMHKIDDSFAISELNSTKFVKENFPNESIFSLSGIKIPALDDYHSIPQEVYDLILQNPNYPSKFNLKIDDVVNLMAHGEFMAEAAYWMEGSYENSEFGIEKGDWVIDAGANIGIFSVLAKKEGACKVFAYEPNPTVFNILNKTIALNEMEGEILPNQCALGNENSIVKLEPDGLSASHLSSVGKIDVTMTTIDHWHLKQPVHFIKADVEGAERDLLLGAQKTIAEWHPKLSLCTYHKPDDKKVLTKMIKKIDDSYRVKYHGRKLFAY